MESAAQTRPRPAAILELLKPITWFPPMWAFACGVISSGQAIDGKWPLAIQGIILAGPMVCAASQAVNDWYDRDVDAINEPQRPIPSGRIPGRWGLAIALLWSGLSALVASRLGVWVFVATAVGLVLAWAYSMPPVRLKQNGWYGNLTCGLCYEGLAWVTGAAIMLGGALPNSRILLIALLYSLGAHGIMTLNDFKAIDGDRKMNIRSLPVQLGVQGAAQIACLAMLVPQMAVAALLYHWSANIALWIVVAACVAQALLMRRFLKDPVKNALSYSGTGIIFYVTGMMACAFALHNWAPT